MSGSDVHCRQLLSTCTGPVICCDCLAENRYGISTQKALPRLYEYSIEVIVGGAQITRIYGERKKTGSTIPRH